MPELLPPVPSWHTSTLSQLAVGSVVAFVAGAIVTAMGVIWFKLDLAVAKDLMAPFSFLVTTFGASYLTARKVNGGGGT